MFKTGRDLIRLFTAFSGGSQIPQAKNSILFLRNKAYKPCSSNFKIPNSLQMFYRDPCVSNAGFSITVRRASFMILQYSASQCLGVWSKSDLSSCTKQRKQETNVKMWLLVRLNLFSIAIEDPTSAVLTESIYVSSVFDCLKTSLHINTRTKITSWWSGVSRNSRV